MLAIQNDNLGPTGSVIKSWELDLKMSMSSLLEQKLPPS